MTKGCKIWLWFIFIGRCLSIFAGFAMVSTSVTTGMVAVIEAVVELVGISLLLFKQKKEGFYIFVGAIVLVMFYNIASGSNILSALLIAAISPLITYYFISKSGIINSGFIAQALPINNNFNMSGTSSNTASTMNNTASTTASSNDGTAQAQNTTYSENTASTGETANENSSEKQNTAGFGNFNTGKTGAEFGNFNAAKNMNITVDLYKELELDRAWDTKTIRKQLREKQKTWIRRQGACNDKEQLLFIDKVLNCVEDAFKYLTKEAKRAQYDLALEQAYKAGIIVDEAEEKLVTLLDQARAYYRKGNIQLAAKCAQEAVDGNINDANAYEFLAQCYNMLGKYNDAINIVDKGLAVFKDNLQLTWLGARISTDGLQDYDGAQNRINRLIEMAPDKSIGHSEQVYMHLRKADENLAFQEIDNYIAAHPEDNEFKRNVAYDLDVYSNNCFYHDAATDSYFIADKNAYEKCIKLRTKACEIFLDEHTQDRLERAQYYGQKEFFDWNMDSVKSLGIVGTIFALMGLVAGEFMAIAFIIYACMGVLLYYSFRPYWQINKTYVTGELGSVEKAVNEMGPYVVKGARFLLKAVFKILELMIRFVFLLASGRLFK